jgi:aspartyl-tRNA(Asn)/glutamyl-tRNA(Gln) amidotransferase subunit A
VPLAVKDLFDTAGVRTTYGSPMFAAHVPDRDAEAVRSAREAGAIVLGKTATHEFAWGMSSINPRLGTCRNPHAPERVPGGSSGGSAAALAAGFAPLALGTDTGGSIRLPAAFCGVTGFKPTWGRIGLAGVFPLAPSLDHVGPMARTPADATLLLGVLSGRALGPPSPLAGRTVAISRDLHVAPLEPAVERAHAAAAARLGELGATVEEVAFPEASLILPTYRMIQLAEALQTHTRAGLYPARRADYGDDVGGRLDLAREVTLERYVDAAADRERLRAAFARVFSGADLLLTPVSAAAPPRIDEEGAAQSLRETALPYTAPQDVAGLPACTVPAGADDGGLPIGLQLTGPAGADADVLAAAEAFGAP